MSGSTNRLGTSCRLALLLAATLAVSVTVSSAWAGLNPMFSGVTGLQAPTGQGETQLIHFDADMPFQYQMQVLGPDRILLRLYNAQLADNLLNPSGDIKLPPGSAITQATVRMPDRQHLFNEEYQEIVLSGPNLGRKTIQVEGATELPLPIPAVAALAPQPSSATLMRQSSTPQLSKSQSSELTMDFNNGKLAGSEPGIRQATKPQQVAALPQAQTSKIKSGKNKPVVVFPALKQVERQPQIAQAAEGAEPVNLLQQADKAPVAASQRIDIDSGKDDTFNRELPPLKPTPSQPQMAASSDRPVPAAQSQPAQTAKMTQGPTVSDISPAAKTITMPKAPKTVARAMPSYAGGPQVVSLTDTAGFGGHPPVDTNAKDPAPSVNTPWYRNENLNQQANSYPDNQAMGYPGMQATPPEAPDPNYQILMPLPRYHGGAPPIVAETLDAHGNAMEIHPKNQPIPEVDLNRKNGGYNALFQADSASSDPGQSVSRLMASALMHYRGGQLDQALSETKQALNMDADNADLYAALAEIQIKLSQLDAAKDAYQKAAGLNASKYNLRYAQVLEMSGKRAEAISVLDGLYRSNPKQAQVAFMLGTLHEEQGHTTEALTYLKQAAQLHPASPDIQYNLGLAMELSGNKEEAELHYQKALSLNPSLHDAAMGLERVRR